MKRKGRRKRGRGRGRESDAAELHRTQPHGERKEKGEREIFNAKVAKGQESV